MNRSRALRNALGPFQSVLEGQRFPMCPDPGLSAPCRRLTKVSGVCQVRVSRRSNPRASNSRRFAVPHQRQPAARLVAN
eukprot:3468816-Pyramimonas_sp.AAC.1